MWSVSVHHFDVFLARSLARRLSEMVAVRPEASSVVEEKRFFFSIFDHIRSTTWLGCS